jgi:ATP-dependent DNA ligase
VACGEDGIASFDRIRYRHHDASVFLYAFDLVELNGDDLRHDPLAVRKATLASLLSHAAPGLRFNEHMDEKDGPLVFAQACKPGPSCRSGGIRPIAPGGRRIGSRARTPDLRAR